MTETNWIPLIASLMVLTILIGGAMRRRMAIGEGLKLFAIWIIIIALATLAVMLGRNAFA